MASGEILQGPFFLEDVETGEGFVYETAADILWDTDELLDGPDYVGYDATGRRFRVELIVEEESRFFGLKKEHDEYFVIRDVEDDLRYDEARDKAAAWIVEVAPEAGVQAHLPEAWLETAPLADILEAALALGL
jgi:hypothetical protein